MYTPNPPPPARWDIFCRVIDNFGDIGVCWRLARQLAGEFGLQVCLWLDQPASLTPLLPAYCADQADTLIDGVRIRHWPEAFPQAEVADVVIEAFACTLPASYRQGMQRCPRPPVWLNLEYLSAEDWIDDCHAAASPDPSSGLRKHFFFPGFSERSGGLLREEAVRQMVLGAPQTAAPTPLPATLEVSLFCYDPAPIEALLSAWDDTAHPVRCHVAAGKPQQLLTRLFGHPGPWRQGCIELLPKPFLPQATYDACLRRCDLNCVRGEDSFLRAQWAARPMLWQIYPQAEAAHLDKLEAFLLRYGQTLSTPAKAAQHALFLAWNTGQGIAPAWSDYLAHWPEIHQHADQWARSQAERADLASNLVKFSLSRL